MVQMEPLDLKDPKDKLDLLEQLDPLDPLDLKGPKELMGHKDQLV